MSDDLAVLADPAWVPHRLDAVRRTVSFVHAPRDVQQAATFLDDESLKGRPVRVLPVDRLAPPPVAPRPLHFIFHSAFCCSTLLARALDVPGVAMAMKEPAILNDLSALRRAGRDSPALGPILALLDRPLGDAETVVVKPSNVANTLIDPILAQRPDVRAVLLHAPLRVFLVSITKKGMWGRIWIRRFYAMLRARPAFEPGFDADALFIQTDLQIAALAWLQQQAQFADLTRRHGPRLLSLDSESFLARRADTLAAVARHFALGIGADAAGVIVHGPAFEGHSKRLGEVYDSDTRAAENARFEMAHAEEIDMIVTWATAIAAQFSIPLRLDRPLLG